MATKADRLQQKIAEFLAERRKSDGGWAEVTPEDWQQLHEVVGLLLELKFARDPDGDLPIEVTIVNRHTHQRLHHVPVPYDRKAPRRDVFRAIMLNLRLATNALDTYARLQELEEREAPAPKS